ncbi:MAG: amidohydrolase, partial [Gammaproteobacteria bacterium]|nr:amidohydrolase [Gammaproteobacteria bacterium]
GSGRDGEIIDGAGSVIMPGLINAHLHSNEAFQQGAYDNLPLEIWLGESYPPFGFPFLGERDYYLRTMLAAIESVRAGVTTVQDDYIHPPATPDAMDAAVRAYADIGLRAWVTVDMWDVPLLDCVPYAREVMPADAKREIDALPVADCAAQLDLFRIQFDNWHGHDQRIRIIIAPCGPQRCTVELMEAINELSERHGVPLHSHTLETRLQVVQAQEMWGKSAIEYLDDLGFLSPRLTIVHGIWLNDRDIGLLADQGCSVVHNPLSNMKLGSGTCSVRKLLNAGINVALGTDGLATSDTADLIEAIRVASLIHKNPAMHHDDWVSGADVFRMATMGGARSGLMEREVGSLEIGKRADLILLDRDHWGFIPLTNPVRQLAFCVTSEAVQTVIVEGRVVMRDREFRTIDEDALRGEIRESAERYVRDFVPAMEAGATRLAPYFEEIHRRSNAAALEFGETPDGRALRMGDTP